MVIGQNNSGKSALLAAISSNLPDKPHRNLERYLPADLGRPSVEMEARTTTKELRRRLSASGVEVDTPVGRAYRDTAVLRNMISEEHEIIMNVQAIGGQSLSSSSPSFPSYVDSENNLIMRFSINSGKLNITSQGGGNRDTIINAFLHEGAAFFNFSAQRINVARSGFGHNIRLTSDARNLPLVLAELQGARRPVFDEIQDRVREIIPSVDLITVTPTPNNEFEVLVWPQRHATARQHAFSLEDSGTGVAQAIAIMTAVVTADESVIVVDEINSFLHPAAVKRLLQICTTYYPQHQYIISTHSAEVISFPSIERLILVEREDFKSRVDVIDHENLEQLRKAVKDLGIGMIDALGFDRVVWVEGPTEEIAFPMLLAAAGETKLPELTFAAVASTGDFSRRGASKKVVIDLYNTVTRTIAPLVDGASFALDRETLADQAVASIEGQTDGQLCFLPRRCLECYAIDPKAISTVIASEIGGNVDDLASQIENAILELAADRQYGGVSRWKRDFTDVEWLSKVDGASLLRDVFRRVTDDELAFRKVQHTPKILAQIGAENLPELVGYVKAVVAIAMR